MKSVVRFITLTVLILNANLLMSREIPGYIIDNSSDTIIGEIEVSAYDIYTGWTVIKGINMEPFHSTVYFRKKVGNILCKVPFSRSIGTFQMSLSLLTVRKNLMLSVS